MLHLFKYPHTRVYSIDASPQLSVSEKCYPGIFHAYEHDPYLLYFPLPRFKSSFSPCLPPKYVSPSCWLFSSMQAPLCLHFLSLAPSLSTHWREKERMYSKMPAVINKMLLSEHRCKITAVRNAALGGFFSPPHQASLQSQRSDFFQSLTHKCSKSQQHLSLQTLVSWELKWPLPPRAECRELREEAKPPAAHGVPPERPMYRSKLLSLGRIQSETSVFLKSGT